MLVKTAETSTCWIDSSASERKWRRFAEAQALTFSVSAIPATITAKAYGSCNGILCSAYAPYLHFCTEPSLMSLCSFENIVIRGPTPKEYSPVPTSSVSCRYSPISAGQ